jgi:biofilm PGA synthesis protein PgaD
MSKLIIHRPDLQPKAQHLVWSVITLIAWGFWFYLWLPAVSLVAWLFGVHLFIEHMLEGETQRYISSLGTYGIIVLTFAAVMMSWSVYNWGRFGRRNRRKLAPRVEPAEIAEFFQVKMDELIGVQKHRIVVVHLSPEGHIEKFTPRPVGSRSDETSHDRQEAKPA